MADECERVVATSSAVADRHLGRWQSVVAALYERRSIAALTSEPYHALMTHKPRLRRLDWVSACEPLYFITACAEGRRKILANPSVHDAFITFARGAEERGVFVGRYVLMPDHVHLFVARSEDGVLLSAWIKSLKNSLSKALRRQSIPSPHWQKDFFDHVLRSSESYDEKWQYIVHNPVRAKLVARVEDWPYQGEICPLSIGG